MAVKRVKHKVPYSLILFGVAGVTFLASWAQLLPQQMVEKVYARGVFPTVSYIFGVMANTLPFSWLDLWIVLSICILIYCVSRRRWRLLLGVASFFYLWFFWGWGLNYHRPPVADRLHLDPAGLDKSDFDRFAETAAKEINRLWPMASQSALSRDEASDAAARRVELVVRKMDGTDWATSRQVKRSVLLEPWYRGAGIDGMFNPFGHEALVSRGPLPFELPFLMSHEIAHVRGIANEGEANLVALLATVTSDDPRVQYSGWLYVWEYLRVPAARLDPGPREDLRAARDRVLRHQIRFVNVFQTSLLDAHLKANKVPGGIHSYEDFVALAIATEPRWNEFR